MQGWMTVIAPDLMLSHTHVRLKNQDCSTPAGFTLNGYAF
ncbi:hypothetical protein SAMN05720354_103171 [Nitrosospira sp. Nsp1]|nr:hypothetical protein SAMN05720354_103171 [Nitrosospira sp. Nsp1]